MHRRFTKQYTYDWCRGWYNWRFVNRDKLLKMDKWQSSGSNGGIENKTQQLKKPLNEG